MSRCDCCHGEVMVCTCAMVCTCWYMFVCDGVWLFVISCFFYKVQMFIPVHPEVGKQSHQSCHDNSQTLL